MLAIVSFICHIGTLPRSPLANKTYVGIAKLRSESGFKYYNYAIVYSADGMSYSSRGASLQNIPTSQEEAKKHLKDLSKYTTCYYYKYNVPPTLSNTLTMVGTWQNESTNTGCLFSGGYQMTGIRFLSNFQKMFYEPGHQFVTNDTTRAMIRPLFPAGTFGSFPGMTMMADPIFSARNGNDDYKMTTQLYLEAIS